MGIESMNESRKIHLPAWAIILDVFGTILLVLGILAQFGGDDMLFSEIQELEALSIVLIFAGVLLISPLIIIIVRQAISRN